MKNLIVVLLATITFNGHAQWVGETFELYEKAMKGEELYMKFYKHIDSLGWQGGIDDMYKNPEMNNLPCIEFGFSQDVKEVKDGVETTLRTNEAVMWMFDKDKSAEVKAFFHKYMDEGELLYFMETKGSISVLVYHKPNASDAEKGDIMKLVDGLRAFFKKHYDEM